MLAKVGKVTANTIGALKFRATSYTTKAARVAGCSECAREGCWGHNGYTPYQRCQRMLESFCTAVAYANSVK